MKIQSSLAHSLFACIFLLINLLLMASSAGARADALQSLVNRDTLAVDETLQLTVRYTGSNQYGQPDFSELETQFEILSTSVSNQFQNINGQVTASTDWTLVLAPLREGALFIPSFRYAGKISDALPITVTAAAPTPAGKVKDVYIETLVEKDSAYVQEQILVKYRLLYSLNISDLETEPLTIENVLIERLPDVKYKRTIQGKQYGVAEFNYALFPQTSGELTIPALSWTIKVALAGGNQSPFGFSGRHQITRHRTDSKVLQIKPVPSDFPAGSPWLPAENITLGETWGSSPESFKIGEPKTRTITLKAEGLMASQLPRIWGEKDYGPVKIYADQPSQENLPSDRGFTSTRSESAAVVIGSGGNNLLPAIKIPWWDLTSNSLKYAEIPQRTINVSGSAPLTQGSTPKGEADRARPGPSSPDQVATEAANEEILRQLSTLKTQLRLWQVICVIVALLCATFFYLWLQRKPDTNNGHGVTQANKAALENEKAAYKQLVHACQRNAAPDIRRTLLQWAAAHWQNHQITTLDDIYQHINTDTVRTQFSALDASLYSSHSDSAIDGQSLLNDINSYLKKKQQQAANDGLASFYPEA